MYTPLFAADARGWQQGLLSILVRMATKMFCPSSIGWCEPHTSAAVPLPQINKDPKSRDYARRSWEKAAKALQQQRQQQQRGGSSGSSPGMGGAGGAGAGDDARGPAGTSSASLLSMSVVDRLYSEAERKEVGGGKTHLHPPTKAICTPAPAKGLH